MPPADDVPVLDTPRSPRLVRGLLVGAVGASLLGLALTGGSPTSTLTATSTASSSTLEVLYADPVAPRVIALPSAPAPARVVVRSSRSRAAAPKVTAPAKKAAAKKRLAFTSGWVRPSYASIVSPYGPRWGSFHKGIDFGAGYGDPIRAAGDGVVVGAGYQSGESGYGLITIIRHSNGYYSAYAHQSSDVVSVGDRVSAGEVIGYVGSTGHSTGAHLHFEIRTEEHGGQVNPATWLRNHGVNI